MKNPLAECERILSKLLYISDFFEKEEYCSKSILITAIIINNIKPTGNISTIQRVLLGSNDKYRFIQKQEPL